MLQVLPLWFFSSTTTLPSASPVMVSSVAFRVRSAVRHLATPPPEPAGAAADVVPPFGAAALLWPPLGAAAGVAGAAGAAVEAAGAVGAAVSVPSSWQAVSVRAAATVRVAKASLRTRMVVSSGVGRRSLRAGLHGTGPPARPDGCAPQPPERSCDTVSA